MKLPFSWREEGHYLILFMIIYAIVFPRSEFVNEPGKHGLENARNKSERGHSFQSA